MTTDEHQPVLTADVLEGLAIVPDGKYIDATFGRGGHSREILKQLGPNGSLLAIDQDPTAVAVGESGSFATDQRFIITL